MKTLPLVLALAALSLPCWAGQKLPSSTPNPFLLAQAQQNMQATLVQSAILTERDSFSVDPGAGTAHLTGRGAATLDSGVTRTGANTGIDITITDINNAAFQQCQGALTGELGHGHNISISGHGFYHLEVQNNVVNQAVITIQQLTDCSVM